MVFLAPASRHKGFIIWEFIFRSMEIGENIARIKDNLFLIPTERFDELTKDPGYKESLIYLIACIVISLPLEILVSVFENDVFTTIAAIPFIFIITIPVLYLVYFLQFLLLKLVGGQAGFLQSVQVFIYGSTISLILSSVPLLGFLASFVALANIVLGSARVHKISLLRSILALVVIPIIIAILVVLLAFSLIADQSGFFG